MMARYSVCVGVILMALLAGCSTVPEISQDLRHFIMNDKDAEMSITLNWKVNNHTDGYNYINLDLYFSDTSRLTRESFLVGAGYASDNDWHDQPVLLFSVGERNTIEKIYPTRYEHGFGSLRKYLGIAVNGRGEKFGELTGTIAVDYDLTIQLNEKVETFTGSFNYNPSWLNKTAILNKLTFDIDGVYDIYSIRELLKPIWVVRNSDFTTTKQIDVKASGQRTQQNDRLIVKLDWSVNNASPGYNHVDLGLYAGTSLPGSISVYSDNPDNYEIIGFRTFNVGDFQREVGHKFFENLKPGNPSSIVVKYTYSVYFNDNPFNRYVYSSIIQSPPTNQSNTIYKTLSFIKSGNTVTVLP